MNPIRASIERPIAVVAAVLMVLMFGLLALHTIPIQLTPDVRRPVLQITTNWGGAAPAEIEREITNRQEEVLKGLEGVVEMKSSSQDGRARITLEFGVTVNLDRALLLLANRLDRVDGYPEEADEPIIATSGTEDNPIAWFILKRVAGNERPVHTYRDFIDDVVRDRIERVEGVSRSNFYGGGERELRVTVDPERLARYRLTVPQVVNSLRAANASISGGDVAEGKRRYVVRTDGEFQTAAQVKAVVLRSESDATSGRVGRVTVADIAEVGFGHKDAVAHIRNLGDDALAVNAVREANANVIEVMDGLREAVAELARDHLPRQGLKIQQVYDETIYIDSSIALVQQNIIVGGILAAIILLLFLRSPRATLVISLAIPVSVVGSFVAMAAMGRSLNVISLAGIAFAVGMVVDAAIVVLENIYRLRQQGLSPKEAAYRGAKEVWGAVLVSALTTVMVFIPILLMELEVGQLFRDIAVAISVSVMLSLLVSVTVIPALSQRLLRGDGTAPAKPRRLPIIDGFAEGFVAVVMAFAHWVIRSKTVAIAVVAVICGVTGLATWLFLPKLDYLPTGNRNLIIGYILPPPGYNLETTRGIAESLEREIEHLWASKTGDESEPGGPPKMRHFFFVVFRGLTIVGATAVEPERVGELIPVLSKPVFREPGTFGVINKRSLFGRNFSGSRTIEFNISGPDLETILGVAARATGMVLTVLPRKDGTSFRPIPGLELGAPEIRIIPDQTRLADNGISARDLGMTVDAFNDGLRVAEITVDGKRIDLTLLGSTSGISQTQGIGYLPVVTKSGKILPAASLADIQLTSGPTEIQHVERERTVTLQIGPPENVPLESALDLLRTEVVAKLEAGGLPDGVTLSLKGTAEKLKVTWDAMVLDLAVAVIIVYLVMAVLFESFVYPLIILLSVPLATAGGVGGLALLNLATFQALDMLTLLGFVILIGIVVNNAILLVHQTLFLMREHGRDAEAAILEATRNRIRPIFMSTLTSVFGMMPLVLFPGAGSELYRGLGSVILGGLALSAVLTLLIIPPLLSLVTAAVERRRKPVPTPVAKAAE